MSFEHRAILQMSGEITAKAARCAAHSDLNQFRIANPNAQLTF
jgi:hypothetical protein